MFKMEIEIDREILEKDGWDFDYSIGVLCDGLKKLDLMKKLMKMEDYFMLEQIQVKIWHIWDLLQKV